MASTPAPEAGLPTAGGGSWAVVGKARGAHPPAVLVALVTLALAAAACTRGLQPAPVPKGPAASVSRPRPAPIPRGVAPTTSGVTVPPPRRPGASRQGSIPAHVMVIVLENRERSSVLDSSDAPYLRALAHRYGQATASYGMAHPSLPNYLALIAGTTLGVSSDCTSCSVEAPTLVDQLGRAGIGWRAYMEGLPHPCFTGDSSPAGYAKKHDPFVYVRHLVANPAQCAQVVPLAQLRPDLASGTAPPFLWITPNLCHDGHDCSTATMDAWMGSELPTILGSSWYLPSASHGPGSVIITFDEGSSDASCCRYAGGGRIATIVVSSATPPGAVSARPVDHAGTLATIEDRYGLAHLGQAACACSGDLLALVAH